MTKTKCLICNKELTRLGLPSHIKAKHNLKSQEYYDKYINTGNEGICKMCPNTTKFNGITKGYSTYCGIQCRSKDPEVRRKVKESNIKTYSENKEEILNKCKNNWLDNYGVDNPMKSKKIKKKQQKTNQERYGSNSPFGSKEIQKKSKESIKDKYGVDSYSKTDKFKEKIEKINMDKYNKPHNWCAGTESRDKYDKTMLKKYGYTNYAKTNECKEKIKSTNLEKYGETFYSKTEECKEKVKEYFLEKYDVDSYAKTEEFKNKVKSVCLKKYGVDNYAKTNEFKEKIKSTNIEKYGVSNYGIVVSDKVFNNTISYLKENGYIFINKNENLTNCNQSNKFKLKHTECDKIFNISYKVIHNNILLDRVKYICPHCYPRNVSKGEQEISDFIKSKCDIKIILNSRSILPSGKEIDMYIPDYNFAIEFNGLYWHSEQAGKDRNYHLNKTKECEELGIHLMHIYEDEWNEKKKIIKYKLLNKLCMLKNRIHTRKCKVVKFKTKKEKELARRFLDIHHIQGRCNSSIYYALVYDNKLVSVMSFTKNRRIIYGDESNNIELVRFASHLKYNIPGAASRLLKHFERDNPNNIIISYAHRRLTDINNNLYLTIGFKFKSISKPGYFYWDGKKRYHRYNFRKSVLVELGYNKDMTEFEITNLMGLLRLWDCGQLVYIKKT